MSQAESPVRFVILGAGAVGGVMAARLVESGAEVRAVARGVHADAIEAGGLRVIEPGRDRTVQVPLWRPDDMELAEGDVVILAVKSQDTAGAVAVLGDRAVPIVCAQNGTTNEERLADRDALYGMMVWTPAEHLRPGEVTVYGAPPAMLRVGPWPSGRDELSVSMAATLGDAGFDCEPVPDIARWKRAKLLTNLGNALDAFVIPGGRRELHAEVVAEGRRVLEAAGLDYLDPDELTALALERAPLSSGDIRSRGGGSTWQSLVRQQPIEVVHFNGYIADLAGRHGVDAPLNRRLAELANEFASGQRQPRSLRPDELS